MQKNIEDIYENQFELFLNNFYIMFLLNIFTIQIQ